MWGSSPTMVGRMADKDRNGYGTLDIHWRIGCSDVTSSTSNAALSATHPAAQLAATVARVRNARTGSACPITA